MFRTGSFVMLSAAAHNLAAYDPRRHITAGELRGLGFYVRETVSDDAFVRRAAVGLDDAEDIDDGTATLRLVMDEPFVVPQLAAVA